MSEITLLLDGKKHHFSSLNLTYSIEQLANSFSCILPYYPINNPLTVEIKYKTETIFRGQLDSCVDSVSNGKDTINITGRSKSANLIDSTTKLDAIYDQPFDKLLSIVVEEFGLSVENKVKQPLNNIPEFQINAESPLSNLNQLAKQQNLMLLEQNNTIIIERPGQFKVTNLSLEEGNNISSLQITKNWAEQYYHYEIQSAWDESKAIVTYSPINKSRKKIIISDKQHDQASCELRAEYEKNLAIAKGLLISCTIPGIHQSLLNQSINKTIKVKSKRRNLNEDLLIKTIELSIEPEKQETKLQLFRAFEEHG